MSKDTCPICKRAFEPASLLGVFILGGSQFFTCEECTSACPPLMADFFRGAGVYMPEDMVMTPALQARVEYGLKVVDNIAKAAKEKGFKVERHQPGDEKATQPRGEA